MSEKRKRENVFRIKLLLFTRVSFSKCIHVKQKKRVVNNLIPVILSVRMQNKPTGTNPESKRST